MSTVQLTHNPPARNVALIGAMLATLRDYWRAAATYQKFLYVSGALLVVSAVFHTGVLIATGGTLSGPISWRKPILFGEAFGLTAITVGWVLTFLPKHRVRGWLLAGMLGGGSLIEVAWVSVQTWRGVAAHFNFSTPLDGFLFNSAGNSVIFISVAITIIAVWSFISLRAAPSFAWAIRVGMVLLFGSQVLGFLIIANGIPKVLNFETGAFVAEALQTASTYGRAGAMKVPHALTLHGIQLLTAIAFLLSFTTLPESRRTRTVIAAAIGYTGLVGVGIYQTFSGLAPLDMSIPTALFAAFSMLLFVGAGLSTLRALLGRSTLLETS